MHEFIFSINSPKIIFGVGSKKKLSFFIEEINCKRALVLSGNFQIRAAKNLSSELGNLSVGLFGNAKMHSPVDITNEVLKIVKESKADCIVSFGGGSTIGLGKAIALRTNLPQFAIPTTYAGSEVTSILGQTENGIKTTTKNLKILPEYVIYDPELTLSLPLNFSITSGLNAIAHAAEGLYAKEGNPITKIMAIEGLKALRNALPEIVKNPFNIDSRSTALYGAWLCGSVLGNVGMALHHKLCHVLGGSFDLPHAETHAILLPHTIAYNAISEAKRLSPLKEIFGDNPGQALYKFCNSLKAPIALRDLGLNEEDLDLASDIAIKNPYWNPREFNRDSIRKIFQNAWEGKCP